MTRPFAYLLALAYLVGAGIGLMLTVQMVTGVARWLA